VKNLNNEPTILKLNGALEALVVKRIHMTPLSVNSRLSLLTIPGRIFVWFIQHDQM
jgi:hypothetical protein